MAKKSRSARKAERMKTQEAPSRASQGLAGQFEAATSTVANAVSGIPKSAIYWGLGALALGAAAVGAYMYRDRIAEVYEEALETFENMGADEESESETVVKSNRRSKSPATDMSQIGQH